MSDSFIFYESYLDAINLLPEEDRTEALWAIINYGCKEIEPETTGGLADIPYTLARPLIDSAKSNRKKGKKGGAPQGNKNAEKKLSTDENNPIKQPKKQPEKQPSETTPETTNVNVNVNDNVNENKNVKENVNVNVNDNVNKTTDDDSDLYKFNGKMLSNQAKNELDELVKKGMSKALIRFAKERAKDYGATGWGYVRQILTGYREKNIRTVDEAEQYHKRVQQTERRIAKPGSEVRSDIYIPKDVLEELERKGG